MSSGALRLTIEETGTRPDTNGYEVRITLAQAGPLVRPVQQGGGSLLLADLPLGQHVLRIEGLAAHCSIIGIHPRTFTVEVGETSTLEVRVFCPGPGAVLIKTVSRGRDVFMGGYHFAIGGDSTAVVRSIGASDSLVIGEEDLPAGTIRFVRLNGVPDNCWVDREQPVLLRPLRGHTRRVEYFVVCIPRSSQMAFEFANTVYLTRGSEALSLSFGLLAPGSGPSLSPDRSRVVFSTPGDFLNEGPGLILVTTNGSGTGRLTSDDDPVFVGPQAWSPDGSRIVFWKSEQGSALGDIYVMNADGSGETRLTHDGLNASPAWSPDGSSIAFCKGRVFDVIEVDFNVYRMNAEDGSGATEIVKTGCDPAWSPDGSKIAFTDFSLFQPYPDLAVVRADGSGVVRLNPAGVISQQQSSRQPIWSPDGSQIAFTGGSSVIRIWIVDFDGIAFGEPFAYRSGGAPSWR
ncbi:MAG TPA: hypothetical protein VFM44_10845 [Gemmatimonadota bacterium]|nr:hypothetical protein [Gemmatimonadota bacterium]